MDMLQTKQKLIDRIAATADEILLVELMGVVEQHDVATSLSQEQNDYLKERVNRVEEGNATYLNAREEAEKIKKGLNDL